MCQNYFSIGVVKIHSTDDLRKKRSVWTHGFRGSQSTAVALVELLMMGVCDRSWSHSGGGDEPDLGLCEGLTFKGQPAHRGLLPSRGPHLLKIPQPPKIPPQTDNHVFKCDPEGHASCSNPTCVVRAHGTSAEQKGKLRIGSSNWASRSILHTKHAEQIKEVTYSAEDLKHKTMIISPGYLR